MKARAILFIFSVFISSSATLARQGNKEHILFGFTLLSPYTVGTVNAPKTVVDGYPGSTPVNPGDAFNSITVFSLSAGLGIDQLNSCFLFRYHPWVMMGKPDSQNGAEIEFQIRYFFWDYGRANLSAIISVKKGTYSPFGGMFNTAYEFSDPKWLPGIGISPAFGVVHAEIQLRGWPRTIIAYAHQPNGLPQDSYGQTPYDLKPVYLNYAISFTLGVEFNVFSF